MLSHRYAEKKIELSASALEKYFGLSRRALSKLDSLAGASRPMANRWLRLRSENFAARNVFIKPGDREFVSRADFEAELNRLSNSDRIELLSAAERTESARQMSLLKARVANLKGRNGQ
jgi:hypothetical protein